MRGMTVMMPIVVAATCRLLISGVDMPTTGADPTIKDGTPLFAVVVLGEHFSMVVQAVPRPAKVVHTAAWLTTVMVIRKRRVRPQVETDIASTAGTAAKDVGLSASATGPASAGTRITSPTMAAAPAQNQRGRGQNPTTVRRRSDPIGVPVAEGGASCVSPATTNPPETIALVDATERAGDITQLPVDGIPRPIVMVLVIVVVVIIVIVVVVMMATWTVLVLGGMLRMGVFRFLNILVRSRLFIGSQGNATSPTDEKC